MGSTIEASPHIKGKYEVVGVKPGIIILPEVTVDLTKITLEEADRLYEKGLRYLKKVEVSSPKKSVKKSAEDE